MSLIFSELAVNCKTPRIIAMHNLLANFVKILELCKRFSQDLVNGLRPATTTLHVQKSKPLLMASSSYRLFRKSYRQLSPASWARP